MAFGNISPAPFGPKLETWLLWRTKAGNQELAVPSERLGSETKGLEVLCIAVLTLPGLKNNSNRLFETILSRVHKSVEKTKDAHLIALAYHATQIAHNTPKY